MAAAAAAMNQQPADSAAAAAALLLELSASDDLPAFIRAAGDSNLPLDAVAPWYGRSLASRRMALEHRSPLHIAALYGSTSVLRYLLSSLPAAVNAPSGSDSATALHCAAAGGAPSSLLAVRLLLDASADPDSLDAAGNLPGDLIAPRSSVTRSLELLLKPSCPRTPSPMREDDVKEKKEYPLDLTLPDIKNGIYGTDEFRMYTFKVKPCSRAYSHDWTECPFVHPGENARRRDPRKYLYSCVPCPEFRKGTCRNGDACDYAHGVFECWLHPAQYRTRLCKDETGCNRRVCFFAHKPEELRTVNPMAASVSGLSGVPQSPRSPSIGDMAAALMMMQSATAPMSPSASPSSGMSTSPVWMNQPPSLQLSSSRLKSSLSARDMDYDLDLVGLEGYQQKLINELSSAASPRSNMRMNTLTAAAAAASRASDYSDLLGSLDPSMLSQLRGLSLKQTGTSAAQFQSSTTGIQRHQSVNQQLLSGYGGNMPSSPTMSASSSLGLDLSTAKAIMNSRASAFAKRSQSFIDRGAVGRQTSLAAAAMTASAAAATSGLSDWGSPTGKLDWGSPNGKVDWGMQGDELNKLRKSASFAHRSSTAAAPTAALDEPDLSWVHSLVKDGPAAPPPAAVSPPQKQYYQMNGGNGYMASDMLSPWSEQMFAEQEQLVA